MKTTRSNFAKGNTYILKKLVKFEFGKLKNLIFCRYQREEAKIQAWVNLQNAKAEAQSRKLEVCVYVYVEIPYLYRIKYVCFVFFSFLLTDLSSHVSRFRVMYLLEFID